MNTLLNKIPNFNGYMMYYNSAGGNYTKFFNIPNQSTSGNFPYYTLTSTNPITLSITNLTSTTLSSMAQDPNTGCFMILELTMFN